MKTLICKQLPDNFLLKGRQNKKKNKKKKKKKKTCFVLHMTHLFSVLGLKLFMDIGIKFL